MAEVFNQRRMNRCAEIARKIMDAILSNKSLECVARAAGPVQGLALAELRKTYFAVGVGDHLTEIPFNDMLVVFTMVDQELSALKNRPKSSAGPLTIQYQISTDLPDEEVVRLLSKFQIQTPHDPGKVLRIVEASPPAGRQGNT